MDRSHITFLTERSSKYLFKFFPALDTAEKLERTKTGCLRAKCFLKVWFLKVWIWEFRSLERLIYSFFCKGAIIFMPYYGSILKFVICS